MDDSNSAVASGTYDHSKSHHGNPMNSEAFLNPRYRYAYVERAALTNYSTDINATRYLHNAGVHEFLTYDKMRLDNAFWADKAQPNYPCSLVANRQKYGGAGSDSYMIFSNGNITNDRYLVPVGDTDSTIGRGGTGYTYSTGAPATAASAAFLNSAHLTGVWSMIGQSVGGTITGFSGIDGIISSSKPSTLYRQIKSPSGMPFLHIKSYFLHDTASKNIIHYDGELRFTGKGGEYFHMRMTAFHQNAGEYGDYGYLHNSSGHWQGTGTGKGSGGKSPIYTLKVGFINTDTPSQTGYTGDAAIHWRWSPHMRYHPTSGANTAHHKSYGVGADGGTAWKIDPIEKDLKNTGASELSEATTATMANDDFWHDFDFRVDWANEEYRVYVDGVEVTTNTMNTGNTTAPYSFANTNATAANARGWELELVPATESGGQTVAGDNDETTYYHTLIDRAAVYIDLSNPLHITDTQVISSEMWRLNLVANGAGTASLRLADDDNVLGLEDFFLTDSAWDWDLLCFRDAVNRPVWSGGVIDCKLDQERFGSKTFSIKATDSIMRLDRIKPIWDIGQEGLTVGDGDDYRAEEQKALLGKLYFGTNELLISEPEVFGDTGQNYKVLTNQRMRLNSAHPIQMYNLEDNYGPNKVYRDWEDYPFAGITHEKSTDDIYLWLPAATAGSNPIYALANGTAIPVKNTGNATIDGGTYTKHTTGHGSYTHPNGDVIYDYVRLDSNISTNNLETAMNGFTITGHHRHYLGPDTDYRKPNGDNGVLGLVLDGYINTNLGNNIRRGTYVSLIDESDSIWDSSDNGTNDAAFSYTGVWKVMHIHEEWGYGRTKIILDCPFKSYTGGSGGAAYLSNPSNTYSPGSMTTISGLKMHTLQGNALYSSSSTSQNSRAHALWMQDLPKSAWFKKTFGVIGNTALFGYGWSSVGPGTPVQRNGYMDNAITVTTTPPTNHTINLGTTHANKRVPSGALKWLYDTYGNLILEFYDSDDILLGTGIATDVDWATGTDHYSTTLGWLGGAGDNNDKKYSTTPDVYYGDIDLVKTAWGFHPGELQKFRQTVHGDPSNDTGDEYAEYWDGRVVMRLNDDTIASLPSGYSVDLSGFDTELDCIGIDGGWILENCKDAMMAGINKKGYSYRMGILSYTNYGLEGAATYFCISSFKGSNIWGRTDGVTDTGNHYVWRGVQNDGNLSDMYFLKRPGEDTHLTWAELGFDTSEQDTSAANFCPPIPNTTCDLAGAGNRAATVLKHGKVTVTMPSNMGPAKTIPAGSYIKVRSVNTDYKHIWIMWADMRNDGSADADGGRRKEEFGLLYPTTENYDLDLSFTDQIRVNGERDQWLSFEPGTDVDIWNVDSTKEPISGNPWSTLGSNSEANSLYHNWEDKAGSFIIIDFSKYFNLNTQATGGRIGYSSGGQKDMGEYLTTSAGKAAIVDNYWKEAAANFMNPGSKSNFTLNENWEYWTQSVALVTESIIMGDETVFIDDASEFPQHGFGPLRAYAGGDAVEEHFIAWFGKGIGDGPNGEDSLHHCATISRDDLHQVAQLMASNSNQSMNGFQWKALSYREVREYWLSLLTLSTTANSSNASAGVSIHLNISADDFLSDTKYDSVQIGSTVSEQYPLRLMLSLKGFAKSTNSNTFYLSDQMRFLNTMALTDNWMASYSLPTSWDLANVPNTERFMIDSSSSVSALKRLHSQVTGEDEFGSVFDSRTSTILSIIKKAQQGAKIGIANSTVVNFNYLQGRDGKLEVRPTYTGGLVLNTTNTKLSTHKFNNSSKFTHVRVYYAGGGSFVDYPDPASGTQPYNWKIIDQAGVVNDLEARNIAKSEWQSLKTNTHQVTVEVIKDTTYEDTMLGRGKYGYIADCTQQTFGGGENWFSHHTGQNALSSNLFPGMVNAMDGNLDAYNSNIASGNMDGVTGVHGNGVSDLYPEGSFTGNVRHEWDDSSVTGDTNREDSGNSKIPWHQNFYWHGARSVSQALQIVHLPHNMPKVSATTGEELRVTIMLQNTAMSIPQNDTVENCLQNPVFWIVLTDCSKHSTWGHHYIENNGYNTYSRTVVDGNGFVECMLPHKYYVEDGTDPRTETIVFSVNYDYLCDLVRFRSHTDSTSMNATTGKIMLRNAHGTDWLNGMPNDANETYNPNSIFPLGCRQFSQFGNLGGLYTMTYAPRIHVVDDLEFTPATTVLYQDANAGYDVETPLSVRRVNWAVNNQNTENVVVHLEEDETRNNADMFGWIRPQIPVHWDPPEPGHKQDDTINDGGEAQQVGDGSVDYQDREDEEHKEESGQDGVYNTGMLGGQSYNKSSRASDRDRMALQGGLSLQPGTIFGQTQPSRPAYESNTIEGLSFGVKTSGRAIVTSDGVVFPGGATSADFVGEHEMLINLPESNLHSGITIDAIVSLPVNLDTQRAVLYAELESTTGNQQIDTQVTVAQHLTESGNEELGVPNIGSDIKPSMRKGVLGPVVRRRVTLFSKAPIIGGREAGTAVRLKLFRSSSTGEDTATTTALTVHSVQVRLQKVLNRSMDGANSFTI